MNKLTFLSLLSLTGTLGVSAQTISGTLMDENNQPLPYANVVLLTLPDSAFVSGTVSDIDGKFTLSPATSNSLLRISSIGYTTAYLACTKTDLGNVRLSPDAQLLDEVVVEGNLPVTRMKGDALVTRVQNSVLSKAGSAEDVLGKIPGITKKQDAFEVFGKGAPLIYINGRQVRDLSELDRLNADEIKQVEVITNPGSRYDATVKAVVRIQTVKRQGEGFGANLRSSYYRSENTDWIEQANLNYRHNDLDIFTNLRFSHMDYLQDAIINQEVVGTQTWLHKQGLYGTATHQTLNADAGFNYTLNENHSIGIRYSLMYMPKSVNGNSGFNDTSVDGKPYDHINSTTHTRLTDNMEHAVNAYYNGNIGDLNIEFNADFLQNESLDQTKILEDSQTEEDRTVNNTSEIDNRLGAGKLIFTYPLWGGSFYVGSECTYTNRKDYYLNPENYVPSAHSRLKELNAGLFAGYSKSLPWGDLGMGLRYEHVKFDYYENEVHVPEQSRKYDNIFPNLSFSTKLGGIQTQLSYTAKTQRPKYNELSNNIFYQDRYTMKQGDPTLRPTLIHDITLNGTWKFIQLSLSYQLQKDLVIYWGKITEPDGSRSMIYYKNFEDNLPTFNALLSAAPHIGCWSPVISAGVMKQWMTIETKGKTVTQNHPLFFGSFNNTFELPHNFLISLDANIQSKGNYQNVYLSRNTGEVNISVRKGFLNDALSIELRGEDLFRMRHDYNNLIIGDYTVFQGNHYDSREFVATLRYKFNATKSKYKGTGAGESQKSRM